MSILIKGMDMPKEGTYILNFISSEKGKHTICLIEKEHDDGGAELIEHNGVVEVKEPHGDLIDRDEAQRIMMDRMCGTGYQSDACFVIGCEYITPTVIEAEGEE